MKYLVKILVLLALLNLSFAFKTIKSSLTKFNQVKKLKHHQSKRDDIHKSATTNTTTNNTEPFSIDVTSLHNI